MQASLPSSPSSSSPAPTPRRSVIRSASHSQPTPQALSSLLASSRTASDSSTTSQQQAAAAAESSAAAAATTDRINTNLSPGTTAAPSRPGRVTIMETTKINELKSGSASPVLDEAAVRATATQPTTEVRAGLIQKPFHIPTVVLIANSPYFADIAATKIIKSGDVVPDAAEMTNLPGPYFFPDLDEYAMALFVRWLHSLLGASALAGEAATASSAGAGVTTVGPQIGSLSISRPNPTSLYGPQDFQTMNHYLSLYVLGMRFKIEPLRNKVMDLVRAYYRRENMTAPAFRLDYMYGATDGPCPMRRFLVNTAAYRAVADAEVARSSGGPVSSGGEREEPRGLSGSMKDVIRGGGQLGVDFVEACLWMGAEGYGGGGGGGRKDARRGLDCEWHDHQGGVRCEDGGRAEPWERV